MEKIWLKNYPPNIPQDLPPLDQNIVQLFETACEEFKDNSAFISFDKSLSYKDLKKQSLHLAGFLQSQGFKKGDVIVIQLPNLLQYPVSLWAAILSGLIVVNMNPLYTAREMLGPIQESQAKGIVLLSNNLAKLKSIFDKTKLQSVIVTGPGDLLDFPKKQIINFVFKYKTKTLKQKKMANSFSFLRAIQQGSKIQAQIQERDFAETLFIQYTGGTTGTSKGACLSQKNILSNLKQCEIWMLNDLEKGKERALAALPLYHIFAFLVNGLVFLLNGFTNVLIANPRQMPSLIQTMKKQNLTIGTGINTLFKSLLTQPQFKKLDFSKWKLFVSGGMSLEPSVQKLWQSVTNSLLIEGYGLTEASPVVCCNRLDKPSEGFAGLPLPSTQVRIVDEKGQELGINEEGELEVQGPQVMNKYYKQEEETKMVFSPDAWLKTGDIAKVNPEGLIQIIDRKKDMINISGLKVYPNEIEEVLLSFKEVKEAAVVPAKDEEGAEIVKAFVVRNTKSLNEEKLKSYCKNHLAPYKIPKQIVFTQEIPKSLIGKPLRRLLKDSKNLL